MLWLKAFHIIGVVSWFAALLYLPRLFVYHSQIQGAQIPGTTIDDDAGNARFKIMERKLFWGIATPGGVLTIVFGLWLWLGWFRDAGPWLHAKLGLVLVLVAYHAWCGKLMLDFRRERNTRSHVWFRWFNEFPVLVLIAIVFLVVFKPQ